MSKRLFVFISLFMIASMVLGACTTATPVATQAGPTPYTCTDSIGCVKIGPTDTIHIAYILVVAGPSSALGIDARNGVQIAIDDAGSRILGHVIKFDGEDGGCGAEGGQSAGTKLAADPTIVGVIGTSCSSEARAALPLLDKAGLVMISPSNTSPTLTTPGSPDNYGTAYDRTAQNDQLQGTAAAEFAYTVLKVTKAATIHDGSVYADQLQKVFAAKFTSLGGTITQQTSVQLGQTDMSSVLAAIATGSPQLIYFPIFNPESVFIIKQSKTTPGLEHAYLMTADGSFSPDVVTGAGADIEGVLVSSPAVSGDAYNAFLAKYTLKFPPGPINIFHAHAYDAFNILKAAIEKVAVQEPDGTLYIPRNALRDAVRNTVGFKGLTGTLTCNETVAVGGVDVKYPGDCSAAGMAVYQYHNVPFQMFVNPEVVWIQGTGVIKPVTPP